MFHFTSVITDIQLKDFKTISKVLYKGNYKWVQNQLRILAAYKVCGVLDPGRYPGALEGKLTGGISARPCHPAYLFILSLSFRSFFPINRTCCTVATLPTVAAWWIFLRSLSRMWYLGWKLILSLLSLPGLMEEPKGDDTPFLLPKPKSFFIAEPRDSKHTSPPPRLFTVP